MADTIIITLPDQEQIEVAHTVATEVTLRALVDSQNNLSATLKAQLASMLKQSGKSDEEIIDENMVGSLTKIDDIYEVNELAEKISIINE